MWDETLTHLMCVGPAGESPALRSPTIVRLDARNNVRFPSLRKEMSDVSGYRCAGTHLTLEDGGRSSYSWRQSVPSVKVRVNVFITSPGDGRIKLG